MKLTPLLTAPFTVTFTLPVVAPVGTVTTIWVGLQLVGVAATFWLLNVTNVLVPLLDPKLVPLMVTDDPSAEVLGDKLVIAGRMSKLVDAVFPPTVTDSTWKPVATPLGTGATICVLLQLLGVAVTSPKVTVLLPWLAPKLLPEIVTEVPTAPEVGDVLMPPELTVKLMPLLAVPFTVTFTFPVLACCGTVTMIFVLLQLVGVAAMLSSLNITRLLPCVVPKLVPVIVTGVPTGPEVGDKLLMVGGPVTVKLTPLLAAPPTVTTTFPVLALAGTAATICVLFQLLGVAAVPLNATVLLP